MTVERARLARPAVGGVRARSVTRKTFFVASAFVLFAVVLGGFARTFFMRSDLASPPIGGYVWIHGAILTAWFVWYGVETNLIPAGRRDLHKKLGWIGAGIGFATIVSTFVIQSGFVSRVAAPNPTTPLPIPLLTAVAWGNYASLFAFTSFLVWGVLARRHPDVQERAMYLATVSLVGPAIVRLGRWPIFAGTVDLRFAVAAVVVLVLALVAYDVVVLRRVHWFTVLGGTVRLALSFAVYAFGQSELMQTLLRAVA